MQTRFESLSEFYRFLKVTDRHENAGEHSSSNRSKDSWDLGVGFKGCMAIMKDGGHWKYGGDKLRGLLPPEKRAELKMQPRAQLNSAVVGFMPNVPALLAGVPQTMYNFERVEDPVEVVRIGVNMSASAVTSADVMFNRGLAILALVDQLEAQRKRVEITVYTVWADHGQDSDDGVKMEVVIKQAHETWSYDSFAFVIAHPAFFRRAGFRYAESHPEAHKLTIGGGYGRCTEWPGNNFDINIRGIHGAGGGMSRHSFTTPAHAKEAIQQEVLAQS